MEAKKQVRLGVVGAGVIGGTIAEFFSKHPQGKVTVVCDLDLERAKAIADKYGARATTSFEDLVSSSDVDLVHIGVPPLTHCSMVLSAFEKHKHVLCEKPMAMTYEETQKMIAAAEEAKKQGIVSAVNYPLTYVGALKKLKILLREGHIGKLRRGTLKLYFPEWPRAWQKYDETAWISKRRQGGPLREIGSHFYYALLYIFGVDSVDSVCATVDYPINSDKAEQGALGFIKLHSGLTISVDVLCQRPMEEEIELSFFGSNGKNLSLIDFQFLFESGPDRKRLEIDPVDGGYNPAIKKLMSSEHVVREVIAAITEHPFNPSNWDLCGFKIASETQHVLDAILSQEPTTFSSEVATVLHRINEVDEERLRSKLNELSGSTVWVNAMLAKRPFTSEQDILEVAREAFTTPLMDRQEWIRAFYARPRLGDLAASKADVWSAVEDHHAFKARKELIDELLAVDKQYDEIFKYRVILLCSELSVEEQIANVKLRMKNADEVEFPINMAEEVKVTLGRIVSLLRGNDPTENPL